MPLDAPLRPIFKPKKRYGHVTTGHQVGVPKDADIAATTITATVSIPTPTISAGAAIAASVVTATAVTIAPSVTAGGDATVTATTVTAIVETLTPTVTVDVVAGDVELFDDIGVAWDDPDFS
jgi:hypothetical protein